MRKRQIGITLIEAMITVAIIAIIAAIAVPSYQDMIEKSRLREAVQSVKGDLQIARSEAFKRSENIFIDFDSGGYCYGTGGQNSPDTSACDCISTGCSLKQVTSLDQVTISSPSDAEFEFRRGTTTAFSTDFSTANFSARVRVSAGGVIELCNPDPAISGKEGIYAACSL